MVGAGGAEDIGGRGNSLCAHAHTLECPSKASVAETEILRRKVGVEVWKELGGAR